MADVEAIHEQIAGVRAVAPQAQASGLAVRNAANWQTTINGTTSQFFTAQQWQLTGGRIFTAGRGAGRQGGLHHRQHRPAESVPREDPIGERFRIRDVSCEVIGTLATRGQGGFGNDQDDTVIMPIKAVQRRFSGNRDIRNIMVAVDDQYETRVGTKSSIQQLLRERRNITGARKTISTSSTPRRFRRRCPARPAS